jgi:hypothetical protein
MAGKQYHRMVYEARRPGVDGECRHSLAVGRCAVCNAAKRQGEAAEVLAPGELPEALRRWIMRNRTTKPRDRRLAPRTAPKREVRERWADASEGRVRRLTDAAIEAAGDYCGDGRCALGWKRCAFCVALSLLRDAVETAAWKRYEVRNPVSGG